MITCEQTTTSDLAARYVAGQLDPQERNSFEEHYFDCARCFDEVQLQLSLQSAMKSAPVELRNPAAKKHVKTWVAWSAVAATVVVMASIGFWRLRIPSRAPQPVAAVAPAQPDPLELLARVEPPPYQTPALRGASPEPHFRSGMDQYRQANYAAAIDELSQADPRSPDVQFFLGVSYLLRNDADAAVSHLRATIALGDSLDVEPAHFYLAKAFVKRKDTASAMKELEAAVAIHGDYEKRSQELLDHLRPR